MIHENSRSGIRDFHLLKHHIIQEKESEYEWYKCMKHDNTWEGRSKQNDST